MELMQIGENQHGSAATCRGGMGIEEPEQVEIETTAQRMVCEILQFGVQRKKHRFQGKAARPRWIRLGLL